MYVCVCVCVFAGGGGGWRHIIEEGLYGSAGGSERRAPVLQSMTLVVSALCVCVRARARDPIGLDTTRGAVSAQCANLYSLWALPETCQRENLRGTAPTPLWFPILGHRGDPTDGHIITLAQVHDN